MATARATLEVRAVARDQMSGPLLASVDRMRDRMNRFGQSITSSMNVLKAFFAMKAAGKVVDFLEKHSTGETQQRFLASQKAMQDSFSRLSAITANELAPAFAKIFDGMRVWAEEWGPAIARTMGAVLRTVAEWTDKVIQGLGMLRNVLLELAETTQFIPLMGNKSAAISRMEKQHFDYIIESRRRRGLPDASPERQDEISRSARALAVRDFSAGRISADVPGFAGEPPAGSGKTVPKIREQLSLAEQLAERWTLTSDVVNTELFRTIVNIEDGLVNALTEVALGTKKASEAFKDFAQAVIKQVLRMFIETGVRGLLGAVTGLGGGGGGGGEGVQGAGGGITYNLNIHAMDSRNVSEALVLADRETGVLGNLQQANLIRRPDVRQRSGRRR